MAEKIKGLALVALVNTDEEFLEAFLGHYLYWCEKALLLVCRLETESPLAVHKIVQKFGDEVRVVDYVFDGWDDFLVLKRLTRAVRECIPWADVLLHVDKDEFLTNPEKLPILVGAIRDSQIDYVDAQMISRFAHGLYSFNALKCKTYDELCRVAPVRCIFGDNVEYGCYWGLKVFLTRTPFIRTHSKLSYRSEDGELLDAEGESWVRPSIPRLELDHFTWSDTMWPRRMKMYHALPRTTLHNLYIRHQVLELHLPICMGECDFWFLPSANRLSGYIEPFHHFYRHVVRHAPEYSKVAMLGSSRLGKSVSWLCEYATLKAKKLHVFGYSHYDKRQRLETLPEEWDSKDYHAWLRHTLKKNSPWNVPSIVEGNLEEGASEHQDHSLFAVWVDLDLDMMQLARVIRAWVPKVQPGGIMFGDFSDFEKVGQALDLIGLPYLTKCAGPERKYETWVAFPKT